MECVVREHYPWVAQHLVVKRISIEHNFHSTYVEFIMAVGNRQLTALVLSETYRNIRVCGAVCTVCNPVLLVFFLFKNIFNT